MNPVPSFVIFGHEHLLALGVTLVVTFAVPLALHGINDKRGRRAGRALAVLLILDEILRLYIVVSIYGYPLALNLPLHLCGVASLLTAWMLWRRSFAAYEIAWFWAIAGSIPAMLTPDLAAGFPHPTFLHFFFSHGLIIFGAMYATRVYGFTPSFKSAGKAIAATLILMLVVAPLNFMLNANYMYLRAKPMQSTLMDYFGPWPWYILVLILIGVALILLSYLPFYLLSVTRRHRGNKNGVSDH